MDLLETQFNLKHRHPWELARLEIITGFIIKHQGNEPKEILDVGSGDAYMAHSLIQAIPKSHAYCVDINYNRSIKKKIQSIFNNPSLLLYSNLSDVHPTDKYIDTVIILDTLEHVDDDFAFLSEITSKSCVNNQAYYYITSPAFQFLYGAHDVFFKHYRRYTIESLKKVVSDSGLDVIDTGYLFFSLLLTRILQLIIQKIKRGKENNIANLGSWKKSKWVTLFFKSVLLIDYSITSFINKLGIIIPGLSCYVICKKREV